MQIKDIQLQQYYAVYYSRNFYIGRAFANVEQNFRFKFLERRGSVFLWPTRPDDQEVITPERIFYGPVELEGHGPFTISAKVLGSISDEYKSLKKKIH